MASATLVVVHHDPDSAQLRDAARELVKASKSSSNSPRYLVYKPVDDTVADGQDDRLTYVWVQHDGGDPNAPILAEEHGEEGAMGIIEKGRQGIHAIGSQELTQTRSGGGSGGAPPKHVLAVAIRYDVSKHDELAEAADAFDQADKALGNELRYGVYETGTPGERLILIGADRPEKHHFRPRIRHHHGEDRSQEIAEKLKGVVGFAWAQPLRYVSELSNP